MEFAIRTAFALQGNEQGRCVAKFVICNQGQHALGQLLFEEIEAMLDFRPYLILVVDLFVQFQHHHAHAVRRGTGSFLAPHFLELEKIAFQRFGYLLLHFLGRGAGIDGYHHSLTDGKTGEGILRHLVKAVESEYEKQNDEQRRQTVVAHQSGYPVAVFLFVCHR